MSTPIPREERSMEIAIAVQSVYEKAGIEQDALNPGIVPLYDLIGAYPVRIAELKDLTYRSAVEFLTAEIGQIIPVPESENRPLAGFLYIYEYGGLFYGCILVKKEDPVVRRRFSAAHELGHYVIHFLPLLESQTRDLLPESLVLAEGLAYAGESEIANDLPSGQLTFTRGVTSDISVPIGDVQQMEREANQFAAELLMPAPACAVLVERYSRRFSNRRPVLARRLASEFLVSPEAMRWRLTNLGLPERFMDIQVDRP